MAKGVSKLEKVSKAASNVNKAVDTLPEILPITRKFSEKIQDVTSNLSKSVYNVAKSSNYNKNFETAKQINFGADVINTSGSAVDLSELLKLSYHTEEKIANKCLENTFDLHIDKRMFLLYISNRTVVREHAFWYIGEQKR